jgi:hypothetical protein
VVVLGIALIALCSPARAQEETAVERAEALHDRGLEALDQLRFARARDLFMESFDIYPSLGTAFNLGLAYRGTGQARAALEIWERVLAGELGPLSDEQRGQVEELASEVRTQVAHLEIRIELPARATVTIDGEEIGVVTRGAARDVPLDPGRRVVSLRADGYETSVRAIPLAAGARERLSVRMRPIPVGDTSVFEEPLFWTIAGIVIAAGAAVAIFFATGPHYEDPTSNEPFGVVTALSFP